MMKWRRMAWALVAGALALTACTAEIGEDPLDPYTPMNPTVPTPTDPNATECAGRVHLLRRLTSSQYQTVLTRMFPGAEIRGLDIPDVVPLTFDYENDATLTGPTPDVVARFQRASFRAAASAMEQHDSWLECDLNVDPCLRNTMLSLASEAFRRPLTEADEAAFDALLAADFTPEEKLETAIAGILDAPDFIYVPEVGDAEAPAPAGLRALQPHELANRLALFLWNDPADKELIDRLSEASAQTDAGYASVVESMMEDPRIEAGIDAFTSQWMPLRDGSWGQSIGTHALRDNNDVWPEELFPAPGYNGSRESLRDSALQFMRGIFLAGDLEELFTSREVMVNDWLAHLYGLDVPDRGQAGLTPWRLGLNPDEVQALRTLNDTQNEMRPATLPENERAGILTHPAVLASPPSDATFRSVYHAVLIMNRITCQEPGQPNFADIDTALPQQDRVLSSREQLEEAHLADGCGGACHEAIDGIGFPFNVYDRYGRFRSSETLTQRIVVPEGDPRGNNNCRGSGERRICEVTETINIDPSGEVLGTPVSDVQQLSQTLANSPEVERCFAEHLYRYGLGRSALTEADRQEITSIAESMRSARALRGAAIALTMSPGFRFVPDCEDDQ